MKTLWAPWRLDFILGPRQQGCIFCKLPRQKDDRNNLIMFRGKYNFIILNRFPYNNGHLMVVPYRHTRDLGKLNAKESAEMMHLASLSMKVIEKTMGAQGHNLGINLGINLGAAGGAGIRDHLHLHVVPRWVGDTNYMPVLAHTKVMIEYLFQTYDRLTPAIQRMAKGKRSKKALI